MASDVLSATPHEPGVAKPDPILVVDNIRRSFGGLRAVDVDHLEIQRGTITSLIGPNGAGKTTLFNLLTGFDRPEEGQWHLNGGALVGIPSFRVARKGVVRTFQLTKSLARLTVLENMLVAAKEQVGESFWGALFGRWRQIEAANEIIAREALERFGLEPHGRRVRRQSVWRPTEASGDGEGPDGRSRDHHARRADGRREPGTHPDPARPHLVAPRLKERQWCSSNTTWTLSRRSATG